MRRSVMLSLAVFLLLGACARGENASNGAPVPTASPTFRIGTAIIETDNGAVMVNIEVADSPQQREVGLSGRRSLEDDEGMLFLFFEDTQNGFWMKDTLIPLSIAFFDRTGEIQQIMDMEPCEADPCTTYNPDAPYRGTLEVNQGAFDEWGVEVGDIIRVSP